MRNIFIALRAGDNFDISPVLRHTAARIRSEHPQDSNPVAHISFIVQLMIVDGMLLDASTPQKCAGYWDRVTEQYTIIHCVCAETVSHDFVLSAINRSMMKSMSILVDDFTSELLDVANYQIELA